MIKIQFHSILTFSNIGEKCARKTSLDTKSTAKIKMIIYGKSVSCVTTVCNEWAWNKDMYSNTVHSTLLLELWGFHTHVIEDSGRLGHQKVLLGKWFLIYPRNIRNYLTSNTVLHPKKLESSTLLVTVKKPYIQPIKANSYRTCLILEYEMFLSIKVFPWKEFPGNKPFRRICKTQKRLLASSCLSSCPSVLMEQLSSYQTNFHEIWYSSSF